MFVDERQNPLKGVSASCLDLVGKGPISKIVASQLNKSATASQDDGVVRMELGDLSTSTTSILFLFSSSIKIDVECTYSFSGMEIFKARLSQISVEEVIQVRENNF